MVEARALSDASGQTEHVYTEAHYAAGTWPHERRVIIKAEVVRLPGREPRDNAALRDHESATAPRFDLRAGVLCARGDIENRIKELHDGLQIGRTSCCRFWANQLRVLLTAAAYVLMQELRLARPRARRVRALKSARCANDCSNSASTSSSPCAASCCICRPPRPTSPPGATSRSRSARVHGLTGRAPLGFPHRKAELSSCERSGNPTSFSLQPRDPPPRSHGMPRSQIPIQSRRASSENRPFTNNAG